MIGYELIGGLYGNAYIFTRSRPLMTGVIGFNSPVEHDHSVGLNTCLNLAGEPLVETPLDAIKSFALGGFKAIYLQMANTEVKLVINYAQGSSP